MKTTPPKFKRYVSVPSGKGVRVDKSITINLPVPEVYAFWSHLENLPRFMNHLESINVLDDRHSHWTIETARGKRVEWDAETIEERENEMISWRSLPGADVENAGSVWFKPAARGQGTVVKVSLKYLPPAGKLGAAIAKLFGSDAETEIEEDLKRLKNLLEAKRPTASGAKDPLRGTQSTTIRKGATRIARGPSVESDNLAPRSKRQEEQE